MKRSRVISPRSGAYNSLGNPIGVRHGASDPLVIERRLFSISRKRRSLIHIATSFLVNPLGTMNGLKNICRRPSWWALLTAPERRYASMTDSCSRKPGNTSSARRVGLGVFRILPDLLFVFFIITSVFYVLVYCILGLILNISWHMSRVYTTQGRE